jgi:hypothetical protein
VARFLRFRLVLHTEAVTFRIARAPGLLRRQGPNLAIGVVTKDVTRLPMAAGVLTHQVGHDH